MTDADLAVKAASGDVAAFGELAVRYGPAARRVARTVLRHSDDADDASQDGFLAAWRAIDRYDPARPFGPWLLRIVLNAARDARRRRLVRETDELPTDLAGSEPSPERLADRHVLDQRLEAALFQLPERQRLAVTLFDAEGYSHREIATVLGIPEGTVRSEVFHARRALRDALGPLWEEWK